MIVATGQPCHYPTLGCHHQSLSHLFTKLTASLAVKWTSVFHQSSVPGSAECLYKVVIRVARLCLAVTDIPGRLTLPVCLLMNGLL